MIGLVFGILLGGEMAKGRQSRVGDTRVAPNGYHYTKTTEGWRLTHHIIAEQELGRSLAEDERTKFVDGNRRNLAPSNIKVIKKGKASLRRRKATLEARIEELQAELDYVNSLVNE
jgi:hypothetical protein